MRVFDPVVIIPPRPIRHKVYRCDREFILEPIEKLFVLSQRRFGVVKMFGEECLIYDCNEFGELTLAQKKTTRLQKRQDRGGQSQNRIARLRVEQITQFLKDCAEKITDTYTEEGVCTIQALLVVGNGFKKHELLQHFTLPVPLTVQSIDFEDDISGAIREMIDSERSAEDRKVNVQIAELIRTSPDLLCFGDEIRALDAEFKLKLIYTARNDSTKYNAEVVFAEVGQYRSVGVRYYTEDST